MVVGGECLVFAANGFHCPLTRLADAAGAASGSVTDIYPPAWFARNLPGCPRAAPGAHRLAARAHAPPQTCVLASSRDAAPGSWRRFTATQVVAPSRGYIWAANARVFGLPVIGYDRLGDGTGKMRWRLLDLVPVVSTDGPDMTRSAAGRLASEIVLVPTAFQRAVWTEGGPDTAVATEPGGGEPERVELTVGPAGQLRSVLMQRWGNPDRHPFGRYPFGVRVDSERTDGGVTVPADIRAGWWRGTARQDDGEFLRARITGVTFR